MKPLVLFGGIGLACLPCLAIGIGAVSGGLAAASALVAPAVGIPLLIVTALAIASIATWFLRHRRACAVPDTLVNQKGTMPIDPDSVTASDTVDPGGPSGDGRRGRW